MKTNFDLLSRPAQYSVPVTGSPAGARGESNMMAAPAASCVRILLGIDVTARALRDIKADWAMVAATQGPRYALAAAAKGMKPRPFAIADFFNEPVVQTIDVTGYHGTLGDFIKVQAFDDFEVAGVHIAVLDGENNVLFQGAAVLTNELWQLAATVGIAIGETVTIKATATDRPGHTGTLSLVHTIA